jgi:hypothetical protein
MRASLDAELADRWIYGKRTSMSGNKVAYAFDTQKHVRGRMSQVCCVYDPALPILVSIDFNVAPMSATVWQEKPWNDAWDDKNIIFDAEERKVYRKTVEPETGDFHVEPLDGFWEVAAANREVLAQVDEYEVWEGGTHGLMDALIKDYGPQGRDHQGGIRVLGDSTGDRRQTSSQTTDWTIIQDRLRDLPHCTVQPGVELSSNYKNGTVNYINPERRDTFNVLNAALEDGLKRVHVCFLPESKLKSGGAAASVQGMSYKADGTFDTPKPKETEKDAVRDHLFDTVRYAVWDFRGGLMDPGTWEGHLAHAEDDALLSPEPFGTGRYGDSWGGVW